MSHSNMKVCTKCLISKEESFFYKRKDSKSGLDSWCKECSSISHKKTYQKYIIKKREQSTKYYSLNKEEIRKRQAPKKGYIKKQRSFANKERKLIIIKEYGSKCCCCGEQEPSFLSIDHINNDGNIHRRELKEKFKVGLGSGFYRWLIKNNFPKENLQLLCMNCQTGKRINNGICPHVYAKK